MNKIMTLVCSLALGTFLLANEKELIKSTLNEATVYSQGAQLHHKASYTIKAGITEISIEGISAYIDPKSLQVKATGNVVIIDSKYTLFYPQPEVKANEGIHVRICKVVNQLNISPCTRPVGLIPIHIWVLIEDRIKFCSQHLDAFNP